MDLLREGRSGVRIVLQRAVAKRQLLLLPAARCFSSRAADGKARSPNLPSFLNSARAVIATKSSGAGSSSLLPPHTKSGDRDRDRGRVGLPGGSPGAVTDNTRTLQSAPTKARFLLETLAENECANNPPLVTLIAAPPVPTTLPLSAMEHEMYNRISNCRDEQVTLNRCYRGWGRNKRQEMGWLGV